MGCFLPLLQGASSIGAMVPLRKPSEIVENLERERFLVERPALAFDADGTLWTGDIGIELFESLVARKAVREKALGPLRELAIRFGLEMHEEPSEQAALLYGGFLDGKIPEDIAFAMMAWVFAGFDIGEQEAFIERFLEEARLEARMQKELSPIWDWAKDREIPTYIVSASPRALLVLAMERLSLDAHVVGMTPAISQNEIEPWVEEPIPYGAGKVAAFEEAAPDLELMAAFGDSAFDAALLSRARIKVAVRPKASLVERAGRIPGLVRIEEAG